MIRTEHRGDGWEFPFVAYAPQTQEGKLPLIVQLHGAGERGWGKEDLSLVEVHGMPKVMAAREYPCLLIMPQCPKDTFWAARVESVIRFIERIVEEYEVDPDRVYLTGLSMGGYGTWYTSMAKPELFAAIVPVCGGGMAWNAGALKKLSIRVYHGAEDTVVSPFSSDEMVERLRKAKADVTYFRVEGVGHNVWEKAYTEELVEWLLSKKREGVRTKKSK